MWTKHGNKGKKNNLAFFSVATNLTAGRTRNQLNQLSHRSVSGWLPPNTVGTWCKHQQWNCAQISSTVTTFHCHRFAISFYFIRLTPCLSRGFEFSFFVGLTVEYGGIGQSYLFEFIERMCPRRTYKNNRSNSRELHTYRPFDEKEIALIHHERHLDSSIGDDQVVTSGSKKSSR